MSRSNQYSLKFIGLKDGNHKFEYNLDNSFFIKHNYLDFNSCNINVIIELIKKSAVLEDVLTIKSYIKLISKTSIFMNQHISKGDSIIVEAQTHLVFVNESGRPIKIPLLIIDKFKPYISK